MKKFLICLLFLFIISCNSGNTFNNINKIRSSFKSNVAIYATPIDGEYIIIDSEKDIWYIKFNNLPIRNPDIKFKEKLIPSNTIEKLIKKYDNE